jgi:acyl-CoA reductase-like NAD-dependent aldehyde dehydrogenase
LNLVAKGGLGASSFEENRLMIPAVHEASEQDTDNAVAAAKAAFPAWSELTPDERGRYFKKLASLIRENNDELAALEASSMGRPIGEFFDAYASAAKWDRYAEAGYSVQGNLLHRDFCNKSLS